MGFIAAAQLKALAKTFGGNAYGAYLQRVLSDKVFE